MKKIILSVIVVLFGYNVDTPPVLDSKLPVVLNIRSFPQKRELETMLIEKLVAKKMFFISDEKARDMVISSAQEQAKKNFSEFNAATTDIAEFSKKLAGKIPRFAQRLMVTVILDKDQQIDSCYYAIRSIPATEPTAAKTVISDSIVKKNDLGLLASAIAELCTRQKEQ